MKFVIVLNHLESQMSQDLSVSHARALLLFGWEVEWVGWLLCGGDVGYSGFEDKIQFPFFFEDLNLLPSNGSTLLVACMVAVPVV